MKNKFKIAIGAAASVLMLALASILVENKPLPLDLPLEAVAQAQTVNGGGYYTPARVINSANTTSTNTYWGPTTNSTGWPISVLGGLQVTNYTKVDSGPGKDTAFQFTSGVNTNVGVVTGQQVVWTIYRNVQGGSPTNNIGSNLNVEKLITVTNAFAASSSVPVTTCTNLSAANGLDGAITTFYVSQMDCSAMSNGVVVTNYSVWVNNQ